MLFGRPLGFVARLARERHGDHPRLVNDYEAVDSFADARSVPLVKSVHVQSEFEPACSSVRRHGCNRSPMI